jgi:hypothetical protein
MFNIKKEKEKVGEYHIGAHSVWRRQVSATTSYRFTVLSFGNSNIVEPPRVIKVDTRI